MFKLTYFIHTKKESFVKTYLWTLDGGRLQYKSTYQDNQGVNWLFLPGGPGLGSEALTDLTALLKNKIPGVIWHFDLPNDGSNILKDKPLSNWQSALIQAISAFEKVILVAHSTPGMYVQTMPELEEILHGLVLIGTAPNSSWQKLFAKYCKNINDSTITLAEEQYAKNPNNQTLRELLIATAQYCFSTDESIERGKKLLESLPINNEANIWSSKHFDSKDYTADFIPKKIPTLIITGSKDHITPLQLFKNNKAYEQSHIIIKEIVGAGHYPWFENPHDTIQAFAEFSALL